MGKIIYRLSYGVKAIPIIGLHSRLARYFPFLPGQKAKYRAEGAEMGIIDASEI